MRKVIFFGASIAGSLFHGFKGISKVFHPGWDFQNNKILLSKCTTLLEEFKDIPKEKILIIIQLPGNSVMPGSLHTELHRRSRLVKRIHYHYLKPPLSFQEFRQKVKQFLSDLYLLFDGATFVIIPPTPRRHFKMAPVCEKCLYYPPDLPDQYIEFLRGSDLKTAQIFSWHEISPHLDILSLPHHFFNHDHIHLSASGRDLISILIHNFLCFILPTLLFRKFNLQNPPSFIPNFHNPHLRLRPIRSEEIPSSASATPTLRPLSPSDSHATYNTL